MTTAFVSLVAALLLAAPALAEDKTPFPGCCGTAMFKVTIYNGITTRRFPKPGAPGLRPTCLLAAHLPVTL